MSGNGHEHEYEPQLGLPERLPADERILWQGSPELGPMLRRVFHLPLVAAYFATLLGLKGFDVLPRAVSLTDAMLQMVTPVLVSLIGLGTLALLAWLTCRTTVYTLTDRRVVMRIGIVLTLTFNLPLVRVQSADLRRIDADRGDIALTLSGPDRIAWLHLWPHARPWHLARPQPMLRGIPQAAEVSALLAQAWSTERVRHADQTMATAPTAVPPVTAPSSAAAAARLSPSAHHPDLSAAA